MMAAIRRTYGKDIKTDTDVEVILHQSEAYGLDPRNRNFFPKDGKWLITIEGLTAFVDTQPDFLCFTEPEFVDAKSDEWVKIWRKGKERPFACRMGIMRKGRAVQYVTVYAGKVFSKLKEGYDYRKDEHNALEALHNSALRKLVKKVYPIFRTEKAKNQFRAAQPDSLAVHVPNVEIAPKILENPPSDEPRAFRLSDYHEGVLDTLEGIIDEALNQSLLNEVVAMMAHKRTAEAEAFVGKFWNAVNSEKKPVLTGKTARQVVDEYENFVHQSQKSLHAVLEGLYPTIAVFREDWQEFKGRMQAVERSGIIPPNRYGDFQHKIILSLEAGDFAQAYGLLEKTEAYIQAKAEPVSDQATQFNADIHAEAQAENQTASPPPAKEKEQPKDDPMTLVKSIGAYCENHSQDLGSPFQNWLSIRSAIFNTFPEKSDAFIAYSALYPISGNPEKIEERFEEAFKAHDPQKHQAGIGTIIHFAKLLNWTRNWSPLPEEQALRARTEFEEKRAKVAEMKARTDAQMKNGFQPTKEDIVEIEKWKDKLHHSKSESVLNQYWSQIPEQYRQMRTMIDYKEYCIGRIKDPVRNTQTDDTLFNNPKTEQTNVSRKSKVATT